jgi:hypothetical protein
VPDLRSRSVRGNLRATLLSLLLTRSHGVLTLLASGSHLLYLILRKYSFSVEGE